MSECGRDSGSPQLPPAEELAGKGTAAGGVPGPGLMADRRIRLAVLALAASGSADGFLPVVLSFAVLRVTGSAGRLGLVLAAQGAAALLVTLAGGLAGDRLPRGRILIASLVARTLAAATAAIALLTGAAPFGLLLAMAGAYGCADGFFGPVSTAFVPDIVAPAQLAPANALTGGSASAAAIIAPALAGVIVAAFGPGAGFTCQAALLAAAAGCLAAARLPRNQVEAAGQDTLLRQLRTGWGEFTRRRWLWLLTGQWTVFSLVILAPVAVLGPVLAERDLGGPAAWGAISSCLALGAVGGQLAAGRIRPPARPAFVIGCLVPVMTAEALALGLAAPPAIVASAAAITGLAMGAQQVIFRTAVQTSVGPAVLARVTAIDLLGSEGGQPIGYALAGPAAAAAGVHTLLAASAAFMLIAATAFSFLRPLRVTIGDE
jgi:predicted MFS family arabinose efflux permease